MIHRLVGKKAGQAEPPTIQQTGRKLMEAVPKAIELENVPSSLRRTLVVLIEVIGGLSLIAALIFGGLYYRLGQGNIALPFLVPSLENAINDQLTGLSVKIESAFVGKNKSGPGVHFRLRNIVLYDKQGEVIANAPLAAMDLNGKALMTGRIAPSEVVFIKPSVDVISKADGSFALSYGVNLPADGSIGQLLEGMAGRGDGKPGEKRTVEKVEIMKAVAAAFEEARGNANTSSYLTQFGVRDATVNFVRGTSRIPLQLPDFIMDLRHDSKKSLIRGFGKLGIGAKKAGISPWKLRFQTQQFEKTKSLQLDVGFQDITLMSLQEIIPQLKSLEHFKIPLSGKLSARVDREGAVQSAFVNLKLSSGTIRIPWLEQAAPNSALAFDIGELKFAYSGKTGKLHILPSRFRWGRNSALLSGVIAPPGENSGSDRWRFSLKAEETRLAAGDFGLQPMIVDEWRAAGEISPREDRVRLDSFFLRAGNATMSMQGRVENASNAPSVYLAGQIETMSLPVFKRLWPGFVSTNARAWVGERVLEGQIVSGDFNISLPPSVTASDAKNPELTPEMIQLKLQLGDLVVRYLPKLSPISVSEAELKITGRQLSVDIPKGLIKNSAGKPINVSNGTFSIPDLLKDVPRADLDFRLNGKLPTVLDFIAQPGVDLADVGALRKHRLRGDVSGVIGMHFPLLEDLEFEQVALTGDLRIRRLKSARIFGKMAVWGGALKLKLSEKGIGANGRVNLAGIRAKLNWQRIFGDKSGRQPPLRLSAMLNNKARKKLGLESLDQTIRGKVPVSVTITPGGGDENIIQVRADLTDNKLVHAGLGWSKPVGQGAVLQFDIDASSAKRLRLHKLNLVTNDLVIEGEVFLDPRKGRLVAFNLPKVSYKLLNTLKISGKRKKNGVYDLVADVASLDGRTLMHNLFFRKEDEISKAARVSKATAKEGELPFDLHARIRRIVGGYGAYINAATIIAKSRKGTVEMLDFKGRLNGKKSIAARMERGKDGRRVLKAESRDAGSSLRMMGLFPKIEGGEASLKLAMGRQGRRKKKGTLWVKNFAVITSQKVDGHMKHSEVFANQYAQTSMSNRRGRRGIVYTRLNFEKLKAPFSYGKGLFVLHDSYVNGPVIGATLRGKVDFSREHMRLGGTYVPLYGLNSAVSEIPVLRELLVGRQGEGVFGVTFGIEGPTSNPTVIVNPVSLLTPGVFRQIFDFNNTVQSGRRGMKGN